MFKSSLQKSDMKLLVLRIFLHFKKPLKLHNDRSVFCGVRRTFWLFARAIWLNSRLYSNFFPFQNFKLVFLKTWFVDLATSKCSIEASFQPIGSNDAENCQESTRAKIGKTIFQLIPGFCSLHHIYMYKNAQYRSQFWTDFHEIHMVSTGPPWTL